MSASPTLLPLKFKWPQPDRSNIATHCCYFPASEYVFQICALRQNEAPKERDHAAMPQRRGFTPPLTPNPQPLPLPPTTTTGTNVPPGSKQEMMRSAGDSGLTRSKQKLAQCHRLAISLRADEKKEEGRVQKRERGRGLIGFL